MCLNLTIEGTNVNDKKQVTPNATALEVMSETQAAQKLGLSRITLQRARNLGQIGFYKVGRRVIYSLAHLLNFLTRFERKDSLSNKAEGK